MKTDALARKTALARERLLANMTVLAAQKGMTVPVIPARHKDNRILTMLVMETVADFLEGFSMSPTELADDVSLADALSALGLRAAAVDALLAAGYDTFLSLTYAPDADLLALKGFGDAALATLRANVPHVDPPAGADPIDGDEGDDTGDGGDDGDGSGEPTSDATGDAAGGDDQGRAESAGGQPDGGDGAPVNPLLPVAPPDDAPPPDGTVLQ